VDRAPGHGGGDVEKRLMSAPASSAGRRAPSEPITAISVAIPKPSASASPSQPMMISERTPSNR
jgi:hypothetical protein